jgi:hypothetical protein
MTLTTTRLGLDRVEVVTTAIAVATSSSLYIAQGHPYLARGVVGDLVGLVCLSIVVIGRRRRVRHEAFLCLVSIGVVLAVDPDWPLQLSGLVWWSAIIAAVAIYVAVRYRCLLRRRLEAPEGTPTP